MSYKQITHIRKEEQTLSLKGNYHKSGAEGSGGETGPPCFREV